MKINTEIKDDKFWYLRTVKETFDEVKSSRQGLNDEEVKKRLEKYGQNKILSEQKFNWFKVLFDKINSLLIYILFGVSFIALISNELLEFIIIIIIILMTVFLGFFQEYKADKTIKALNKLTAKKIFVLRNDKKTEVLAEDLVVGDIVFLNRGDIVPADLRLIEVSGLLINEAVITGESKDRAKIKEHISDENISLGDMTNIAFSSTFVTGGSGIGVVVETGLNTIIGKISSSIEKIKYKKSPIQKKIDLMSKRISYIVLAISFILLIILLFKGNNIYFSLLLVSALAIAGIPESFPLVLTLAFSNGIKKMAENNAIVKDMNSVETLGTTSVICTDKTGTLTENKMRVSWVYLPGNIIYEVKGVGYEPVNEFYIDGTKVSKSKMKIHKEFLNTAVLCNDAELNFEDDDWKIIGEPTEASLVSLAKSLDFGEHVSREFNKRIFVVPFDPMNKYMITVNQNTDDLSEYTFHLKGAGEILLEKCRFIRFPENKVIELTPAVKKEILRHIDNFNSMGLRVLSLASKAVNASMIDESKLKSKCLERDYIYEGFVGIEDPIRPEVFDAVQECHRAGIKTVMITGDHKLIAQNIGVRLKLFAHDSDKILEGFEIDKLTDEELDDFVEDTVIFARTSSEHKLRIVNSFQRIGKIVAMTGDGVNDAPALKKADIGVAMGKNGTEVAKEASNMVLADDNFATIVNAVKEGRTIYSNIRRFIYYLLTGNFTELGLIIFSVILGFPLPLTALMILFVNLVTSTIPALALSIEPTHIKVMNQKPRNPKERLLSGYILTKIIVLIPIFVGGTLGLFMWELLIAEQSIEKAMTIAFTTLITFELFHAFNARRLHTTIFDKGFFSNMYLFIAVGVSFFLMLLAVYSQFGQSIFSTVPLMINDWVLVILVSSISIVFTEVIKLSVKSEFNEQRNLQGVKIRLE